MQSEFVIVPTLTLIGYHLIKVKSSLAQDFGRCTLPSYTNTVTYVLHCASLPEEIQQ